MPQPAVGDQYVDMFLSNVLVAWVQDQKKYMATRLFPNIPVDFPSGIVPQYKIGDLYRNGVQKRAPGTAAETIGWNTDNTKKYSTEERAIAHKIPDPIRAATMQPYDQDRDATVFVGQQMLINREIDFVNAYFATSIWCEAGKMLSFNQVPMFASPSTFSHDRIAPAMTTPQIEPMPPRMTMQSRKTEMLK